MSAAHWEDRLNANADDLASRLKAEASPDDRSFILISSDAGGTEVGWLNIQTGDLVGAARVLLHGFVQEHGDGCPCALLNAATAALDALGGPPDKATRQ